MMVTHKMLDLWQITLIMKNSQLVSSRIMRLFDIFFTLWEIREYCIFCVAKESR